ncbi:MAG: tRNA-dihydrouridine synthase family protein [Phycisphaerae bacterium]|nr:tRNA-dihydrouridine synthase family protein [Phycisphaerae bacterium]
MLTIGNIKLKYPFIQAALSGYSDRAMRVLAKKFGCELTFSGVILDSSASYKPLFEKPNYILKDDEHPIGAQLLGTEPEKMAKAAQDLCRVGYDLIDLNFACPAPKVVRKARGGALLAEPKTVIEIFKQVRDSVKCPVIMKLRRGFDDSEESARKFRQICDEAVEYGVDGLIVHGRSVEQRFKGTADWNIIKQLKEKFPKTTIIGSGDLFEPVDIVEKLKTSGADGAAIARGAIGKPWIFRQIIDVLEGRTEIFHPDIEQQGQIILEHFEMLKELYDIKKCIWYFRKFLTKYSKSHLRIKKVSKELITAQTEDQLKQTIKKWYNLG